MLFNQLKVKIVSLTEQVSRQVKSVNELEIKSKNISTLTFKGLEIGDDLKKKDDSIKRSNLEANQVKKIVSDMKDKEELISKREGKELEEHQFILLNELNELARSYEATNNNLKDNLWVKMRDLISNIMGKVEKTSAIVLHWSFKEIVKQQPVLSALMRLFLPSSRS